MKGYTADNPMKGVVALIQRDGCVLMIQRSSTVRAPLTWCFPGGGIEHGEEQAEALVRELREELGLEVEPDRLLMTQRKHEGRLVLYCWSARITSGEPTPDPREVADYAWMRPDAVRSHAGILPGTTDILDALGL
jgi:8-oxo-dGTP pyrophosphatase MutT (NUDIX family)